MPESADFQTLFSQLQSRYPSSSLTSELVQIQTDQYVVRAMVQVGGVMLATSMAAAATVELAEDQARLRVLRMLGIHSAVFREPELHSAENGIPPGRSNYFLDPENSLTNSFPGSLDPAPFEDTLPPSLPALDKIFQTAPASPLPLDPSFPETLSASEAPSVPLTTALGVLEPEPESSDELPENTPIPEVAPATDRPSPAPPPRSSKSRKTGATQAPPSLEPSPSELPPSELPPSELPPPSPGEPLDLTPLFLQIEDEMDRIGWTKEQGRTHLKRAYNKRSRQQLTDEELVDFLGHLKTQSPVGEEGE